MKKGLKTAVACTCKVRSGNFSLKQVVFLVLIFLYVDVTAQPGISVSSAGRPLSDILEEISGKYGTRFAYDSDLFSLIKTTFTFNNVPVEEILQHLLTQYQVVSKSVDGTWVLLVQNSGTSNQHGRVKSGFIEISGYVRDGETGENLIYCNIAAEENRGGMTNELGFFKFPVPDTGLVRVLVSHLGYQRLDTVVPANQLMLFELKPSVIIMDPVKVVHYESQVLQASPQPEKIAFNPLKTSAVPRIANDDMGNSLLLIPGIEFFQGGSSGLSIRGSEPTDNLVLFDGIPVLETSHLLGNMSVLNAKFVQQAFVSRGGFDASYGGRVSGLIELIGKSGKNNKPYLDLSANLLNTNILSNIPLSNKFSVTAAWRRSFIDRWQNYLYFRLIDDVVSSDDNPVTSTIIPEIRFQDLNAKISYHPADNFEVNLNFLYGNDHQKRDFELLQTTDFYRNESMLSKNAGFSLNLNWQVNSSWYHSFSAGFSDLKRTITDETGELQTVTETVPAPGKGQGNKKGVAKTREITYTRETHDIDNGFNQVEEFRAGWKSRYEKGLLTSEAGLGWTYNRYTYNFFASRLYDALQIDSIANSAGLNHLNGFIQQNIDVNSKVRFRWGIRANFDPELSKVYWQPRGGLEYTPVNDLKIYFLSGIYYQFMSGIRRFDSEGHFSRIWFLPGEDGKGVISGSHYILGGKYERNGWFFDLEGYHKNSQGRLNLFAESYLQGENRYVTYLYKEGMERKVGVDLFVQKKHFIFNHMAGYSMSATEEKIEDLFGNEWFPGYNDRTHRLKFTEMINWKMWTFTATWQLASGLPVYRYVPNQEDEEFLRSGSFSQVNAALIKNFTTRYFSLSAGASLLNIFNRANIVEVNYLRFSSETGSMTIRSDVSAMGTTPVFFVNIKF